MPQPTDRVVAWGRRTLTRPALPGVVATTALGVLTRGGQQLRHVLQRRYPTVAVTGMTGVGKTVAGRPPVPPDVGARAGRVGLGGDGVPGPARRPACAASASAWCPARTPRPGSVRSTRCSTTSPSTGSCTWWPTATPPAAGYRGHDRARLSPPGRCSSPRELEDWTITAHRIASMAVRREPFPPGWSSWSPRRPVRRTTSTTWCATTRPGSGTPFADRLDELRPLAGAAKLSIDVLPVCSTIEGDAVTVRQRDAYLAALESRMAQLAGHV